MVIGAPSPHRGRAHFWRVVAASLVAISWGSTSACALGAGRLPQGPGVHDVADTARFIEQLARRCSPTTSFRVAFHVRGSVGARRVSSRVLAGFRSNQVRFEPEASGRAASWILVARGSEATLALRDGRILERNPSDKVLRALLGVEMPVDAFSRVLIGCEEEGLSTMSHLGPRWARLPSKSGGTLYIHRARESDAWRPKALFHSGESLQWRWRVDYDDFANEFPQRMRVRSADGRIDLDLRVSQLDLHVSFEPTLFEVALAPNARRVTPDTLEDGEIVTLPER